MGVCGYIRVPFGTQGDVLQYIGTLSPVLPQNIMRSPNSGFVGELNVLYSLTMPTFVIGQIIFDVGVETTSQI